MNAYGPLAPWYDALTGDVPYDAFADYYESIFAQRDKKIQSMLDLACGTGTLSSLLAQRNYEMIAVDRSADMLSEAMCKFSALPENCTMPMALCQDLAELDLYGTSDAAVSCLDSLNYLSAEDVDAFFTRLRYFLEPGGLFIFDVNSPAYFKALDGQVFVDEQDDVLCLWRAALAEDSSSIAYGMDVFRKHGRHWLRDTEEHVEYIHEPEMLIQLLEKAGFRNIEMRTDGPLSKRGRLFFIAENAWYEA